MRLRLEPSLPEDMASLTPFEVGAISAHVHHGYGPTQIAKVLKRADKTVINKQTIANAIAKLKENPKWRGEREPGTGRKRKISPAKGKQIEDEVLKNRGREKVTVGSIKRKQPRLRACSNSSVAHTTASNLVRTPRNKPFTDSVKTLSY